MQPLQQCNGNSATGWRGTTRLRNTPRRRLTAPLTRRSGIYGVGAGAQASAKPPGRDGAECLQA
jgi:hypothetical protein